MDNDNHLTLAVAGSGKTQRIVDACSTAEPNERILVLTYTSENQKELKKRLARNAGNHHGIDVSGWFSFLIGDFVRPYLPFLYPDRRVRGFDFKSPPQQRVKNEEWRRYFNNQSEVRKVHLSQLAHRVNEAAAEAPIRRLERIYDRIFIDEVQDLCGWDLEILECLMKSRIPLQMVGDVRQAILVTNPQERKNKKYKYMRIWDWFRRQEGALQLSIHQECTTFRCRPEIAKFADSLFSKDLGFETTVSLNSTETAHDGIYFVKSSDADAYVESYNPLFLRRNANSGRGLAYLHPMNIGISKGLGREHVLIYPTDEMVKWLSKQSVLEEQRAAYMYVAITRAQQSVAFILDSPGDSAIPYWTPDETGLPLS